MKKLLSVLMALSMALALAVPAFAEETVATDPTTQSTTITGITNEVVMEIAVSPTGNVVLNPYELEYDLDAIKGTGTDDAQVVFIDQYVENLSNAKIAVTAEITGSVGGSALLSTVTTVGNTKLTTKSAYVYFQMTAAEDATTEVEWPALDAKTNGVVLVAAKPVTAPNTVVLAAGTPSTDDGNGGTTAGSSDEGGVLVYHLAGDVCTNGKTAWTSDDTVGASITFTFLPTVADTTYVAPDSN